MASCRSAALPAAASSPSLRRIVLTSGARSSPSTRPSTAHPDRASDLPQPGHLDAHGAAISQRVRTHRGRLRESTAKSILATFDAPGQAIQSAAAIRADAAAHGIQLRAGIHTGEVDLAGDQIGGISVEIVRRVTAHAQPAEILVSRTVKDLVIGSGVSFADRGTRELGAIPGHWQLFAVTTPQGQPGQATEHRPPIGLAAQVPDGILVPHP